MTSLEQIINQCKRHNILAQRLLYEKYASRMIGICLRYVADIDTAKDIVQEGFIKVFSKINMYNGNGSFDGWIKKIFINTTVSYIRKNFKNQRLLNIDEIEDKDLFTGSSSEVAGVISETEEKQNEFGVILSAGFSENDLLTVLNKLPIIYKLVFNLYFIEKLKHEEIAAILDIDISTSRTRLSRARIIVKKELYKMSLEKTGKVSR